jgi:hypothetical protein
MCAKMALSALAVGVIVVGVLAAKSSSVVVAATIVALAGQGLLLLRSDARSTSNDVDTARRGYD